MAVPNYDHIVVVVMENHDYSQIIGNSQAPYINNLAAGGALLTNYDAISHPSQPNYFALYAGSTFGTADDNQHSEPDPTLATILQGAGKTFTGYVEGGSSDFNHNPWESFPEGFSVEKDFSTFPATNYASLPNVSFVIPNVDDDMHNGTIQQGDTWLQTNIDSYAQWAKNNNSLLIVTWDENDGTSDGNHVATILYGADVNPGTYATSYNHYDLLSTLLAANGLTGPNNAATAAPINVFGTSTAGTLAGQVALSGATEGTALAAGATIASFTDTSASDTASAFTAQISWGDGTSSAGTISGSGGTFAVTGAHTYADEGSLPLAVTLTRSADNTAVTASGTVAVAEADALTPHGVTLTGTAGQALSGVTLASFTDSNAAAVAGDFAAQVNWGDGTSSAGTVSGAAGTFTVAGTHTYAASGTDTVSVTLSDDAPGTATATATTTAQIAGGSGGGSGGSSGGTMTVSSSVAAPIALSASTTSLTVTNTGAISTTTPDYDGVDGVSNVAGTVTNSGTIDATGGSYSAGVWLPGGGSVTNNAGASIAATYGVVVSGKSGTVTNSGTITGSSSAVLFMGSGTDRLVVEPSAVFNNDVEGGSGQNTLELAGGTGSIDGMSGASGTVTENGSWTYEGFQTLTVDQGGIWTLNGGSTSTLVNDGTIAVTGSVHVTSRIDPGSTGLFQLTSGSTLDVAAALGAQTQIAFLGSSHLVVDAAGSFGTNVGSSSYAGPQLQDFAAGDSIDLKGFSATGAVLQFNATDGVLQITNGAAQHASLGFQLASLGTGTFNAVSDGHGGTLLSRA